VYARWTAPFFTGIIVCFSWRWPVAGLMPVLRSEIQGRSSARGQGYAGASLSAPLLLSLSWAFPSLRYALSVVVRA
jgi:hypothetical protein